MWRLQYAVRKALVPMFDWFSGPGLIDRILDGNGKEKRLRELEREAKTASRRKCRVIEAAVYQTTRMMERAAELIVEDDPDIDIDDVRAEIDREFACRASSNGPSKEVCSLCFEEHCEHRLAPPCSNGTDYEE